MQPSELWRVLQQGHVALSLQPYLGTQIRPCATPNHEQLQSSLFYSFLEVIWLTGSKKMKKCNISEQSINYRLPSVTLSGAAPNPAEASQSGEVGLEAAA